MKDIIETLYPMPRYLLGAGYDNALEYIKHLIDLEVIEIPSGTQVGTWTVPNEWIVHEAWVKDSKGKKVIDIKKDPLSLIVGSIPFKGKVTDEYLKRYWVIDEGMEKARPYLFKYYDKDWGFCVPKEQEFKGEYEVLIDTEEKPGVMKIGVHTIKGESNREILLFAHLDHPFQANDNLSAVACLVDLATKLKSKYTIKIIFCPETIGSIAYALTQYISRVEFVVAVDICGNDNDILLQKTFIDHNINRVAHLAISSLGEAYRKAPFRASIGSDEYVFNDPQLNIPAIMLSRHPYPEYHTSEDTPDKIKYDKIEEMQKVIIKMIDIYEKDFIPVKLFKGQLMRSKYGIQSSNSKTNLSWDYLIYSIDGKRSLAQLCCDFGLQFDQTYEIFKKLKEDGYIGVGFDFSEVK